MKPILAALLLALPLPGHAHDYRAGALTIAHPMAPTTPRVARSAAGYLTITNTGDTDDALVAIETAFPSASIHRSEVVDGIATMAPVDRLEIPAGETVTLAPGGLHVMFLGLDAPLMAEDRIPATLVFEHAGRVEITFNVEPRDAATSGAHRHEMKHAQ